MCSAQARATQSASDYDGQKTVPRQGSIGGTSAPNQTTLHGTGQASQGAKDGANHNHSEKHNEIATTRGELNAGDYDSGKASDEASAQASIRNNVTTSMASWVNQRDIQAASVDLAENEWWADEVNA